MGAIDIQTGELLEGDLPNRALKLVQEWLQVHRQDSNLFLKWDIFNNLKILKGLFNQVKVDKGGYGILLFKYGEKSIEYSYGAEYGFENNNLVAVVGVKERYKQTIYNKIKT